VFGDEDFFVLVFDDKVTEREDMTKLSATSEVVCSVLEDWIETITVSG